MKSARVHRDVKPENVSGVELVIGEDLDARAERRVLEIIRRIRDKHRARVDARTRSGAR